MDYSPFNTLTGNMEDEINLNEEISLDDLKAVYIHFVGVDSDGFNIYHFLLATEPGDVFAEGWGEVPACNEPKDLMKPVDEQYTHIKELKTKITLNLAQNNCCFSYQDCRDGILSMGYEDISEYEEYPDPFRLVFHYGESITDIDSDLAQRDLASRWLPKEYANIDL